MLAYSVVIPVYNAQMYLEECIDSILKQRSDDAYEVILVDDGSKDRSPQICDRYAEQFPCVRVIHQANQGVSAARNAGIAVAKGKYILFLDSDDVWIDHFLIKLESSVRKNPDIIEFGYQKFNENGVFETFTPENSFTGGSGLAYLDACSEKMCMPTISCWAAAFRRELIQENEIVFPVGITYGEDALFHLRCMQSAAHVISLAEPMYLYRENKNGITQVPSLRKMRDQLCTSAEMYRMFPCALFANYYCSKILSLERLSKQDVLQLKDLLLENRDILRHVSGVKMCVTCMLFKVFGWYETSRLVQMCIRTRDKMKG